VIPALDYLKAAKSDKPMATGKQVVIIGAGNVGCDVAAEAYRLGADQVTLVDIQKPLAFGKERIAAEALGATFKWPFMTREVTAEGLVGADGTVLPAQTVIISIGDIPSLPFLPESVEVVKVAAGLDQDRRGRPDQRCRQDPCGRRCRAARPGDQCPGRRQAHRRIPGCSPSRARPGCRSGNG
jgi:NADPH-dependent 2,4-dienoyl-CoA reductase/sulfur reductase-like enzyme